MRSLYLAVAALNRSGRRAEARQARPRLRPLRRARAPRAPRPRRPRSAAAPVGGAEVHAARRRARPAGARRMRSTTTASPRSSPSSSPAAVRSCSRRRTSAGTSPTARTASCSGAATRSRLRAAVERILADDELRERLGRGARDFAERTFSWRESAEKLLGLYERALASGPRPHPRSPFRCASRAGLLPAASATRPCATTATRPSACPRSFARATSRMRSAPGC